MLYFNVSRAMYVPSKKRKKIDITILHLFTQSKEKFFFCRDLFFNKLHIKVLTVDFMDRHICKYPVTTLKLVTFLKSEKLVTFFKSEKLD